MPELSPFNTAIKAWEHPGIRLLRRYFRPQFTGLERIDPDRPTLFVGNHGLYGLFDVPLLHAEIQRRAGIWLRGLIDPLYYRLPVWGKQLERLGAIPASTKLCTAAMQRGEPLLLFPGGNREILKHRNDPYRMTWRQPLYFLRLAIEHGYCIQPFASVGADDAWDILVDANDWQACPLAASLEREFTLPPLTRGLGFSPLPRPERLYYVVGTALEPMPWRKQLDDPMAMRSLRNDVVDAITELMNQGLRQQASDDSIEGWRRLLCQL